MVQIFDLATIVGEVIGSVVSILTTGCWIWALSAPLHPIWLLGVGPARREGLLCHSPNGAPARLTSFRRESLVIF